jgi:hypothetical protein
MALHLPRQSQQPPGTAVAVRQSKSPALPPARTLPSRSQPRPVSPSRLFFVLGMLASSLIATSIGVALAWDNSEAVSGSSQVGALNFAITYRSTGHPIELNNGAPTRVGTGSVQNTGDFEILYVSASAQITGVSNAPVCDPGMFSISVFTFGALLGTAIKPGSPPVDGFDVNVLALPSIAPECHNATVSFTTSLIFRAR